MSRLLWVCDSCNESDESKPWNCPGCGKEVCENCFDSFAHCSRCTDGKTDKELIEAAKLCGFDFDAEEAEEGVRK